MALRTASVRACSRFSWRTLATISDFIAMTSSNIQEACALDATTRTFGSIFALLCSSCQGAGRFIKSTNVRDQLPESSDHVWCCRRVSIPTTAAGPSEA